MNLNMVELGKDRKDHPAPPEDHLHIWNDLSARIDRMREVENYDPNHANSNSV